MRLREVCDLVFEASFHLLERIADESLDGFDPVDCLPTDGISIRIRVGHDAQFEELSIPRRVRSLTKALIHEETHQTDHVAGLELTLGEHLVAFNLSEVSVRHKRLVHAVHEVGVEERDGLLCDTGDRNTFVRGFHDLSERLSDVVRQDCRGPDPDCRR